MKLAPDDLRAASTVAAPLGLKALPLQALGATGQVDCKQLHRVGIPLAGIAATAKLASQEDLEEEVLEQPLQLLVELQDY